MTLAALIGFNVLTRMASLLLLVIGSGVICGLMRIINPAHGEFLMLGAYETVLSTHAEVNIWLAMLIVAPVSSVSLFGILVERMLIRFLYGRMIDSMLATWGLSLGLIGPISSIFGTTVQGVFAPLHSFPIGPYEASIYSVFTISVAILTVVGLWTLLKLTCFGLIVRATMQNPDMAAALGLTPGLVYMATFGIGAALKGLAGGVIAPVAGMVPGMGAVYVAKAFITALGGGPAIIMGSTLASGLFGAIDQIVTFRTTPVFGQVALLLFAVVMIRVLPQGITGRFFRRSI